MKAKKPLLAAYERARTKPAPVAGAVELKHFPAPAVAPTYEYQPPTDEQLATFAAAVIGLTVADVRFAFTYAPNTKAIWLKTHREMNDYLNRMCDCNGEVPK